MINYLIQASPVINAAADAVQIRQNNFFSTLPATQHAVPCLIFEILIL